MAKKNLTEYQKRFLEVLFEEAKGDYLTAKKLAGYKSDTSTRAIVASLEDEIFELTKKYILGMGPKAAYSMKEVLERPTDLGNKEKMAAAKDFLDRAGFKQSEKVEVKTESPLFILPPKKESDA